MRNEEPQNRMIGPEDGGIDGAAISFIGVPFPLPGGHFPYCL